MMLTVDESLRFARQTYTPQSFAGVLCAEVERLRAELAARPMPECACGDGIMPSNAGCCATCMYEMELTIKGLREELAARQFWPAHLYLTLRQRLAKPLPPESKP